MEKSLDYDSPAELSFLFPKKYAYVSIPIDDEDLYKVDDDQHFETVKALFFDKDVQKLVCVDNGGCEVALSLRQLEDVKVFEKTEEPVFMAEVRCRFTLPLTVQFAEQVSSAVHLTRGLIDVEKVIVRQTVIATSRDEGCNFVLTFLDSLDVTVIPLQESTLTSPEYDILCKNLSLNLNLSKVEESIEKDDVVSMFLLINYATYTWGVVLKRFRCLIRLN